MKALIRSLFPYIFTGLVAGCSNLPHDGGRPTSDAAPADIVAQDRGVLICDLVGQDSIVHVLAADAGTRYTLCDRAGTRIAANLDDAELAALRPDLDPRRLHADGSFELMLTDSNE